MSASSDDAIRLDLEISLELERLSLLSRGQVAETLAKYCDHAISPVAVGRKNWLRIGSERAGPPDRKAFNRGDRILGNTDPQ